MKSELPEKVFLKLDTEVDGKKWLNASVELEALDPADGETIGIYRLEEVCHVERKIKLV